MSNAKVTKKDFFNIYKPSIPNYFEKGKGHSESAKIKICYNCGAFIPKYQYICGMCKSKNIKKINSKDTKLTERDFFES